MNTYTYIQEKNGFLQNVLFSSFSVMPRHAHKIVEHHITRLNLRVMYYLILYPKNLDPWSGW